MDESDQNPQPNSNPNRRRRHRRRWADRSPRISVVLAAVLLMALGLAVRAGADVAATDSTSTTTSTTEPHQTTTTQKAVTTTTEHPVTTTTMKPSGTTTTAAPVTTTEKPPGSTTTTMAGASATLHVTVQIREAVQGSHSITLGINTPPQSHTFASGASFDFSLNTSISERLSATLPSGFIVAASGAGCPTLGVSFTPLLGTTDCTYTFTQTATISIDKVTSPAGDPTSFSFSATDGLSPATFELTDSATPRLFSDVVPDQSYTVTESVPSGWTLVTSGTGCTATTHGVMVMPTPGANVHCVFTDTRAAHINIHKTALGGDGTFSFHDATLGTRSITTNNGVGSASYVDVAPGAYSLSEQAEAGWAAGSFGGDCRPTGTVVVTIGHDANCTITNTRLATISIDKVTVPAGDSTSFSFTATGGLSPAAFQLTDSAAPRQFTDVTPGASYTITEAVPSGWKLATSGAGCVATANGVVVTPAAGANVHCVFTDTEAARIVLHKTTVGGNGTFEVTGGSLGTRTFTTTSGSGSATFSNVTPGTYTLAEVSVTGWSAGNFGGDCDASGKVTVAGGEVANCTLTNTRATGTTTTTIPNGSTTTTVPGGSTTTTTPTPNTLGGGGGTTTTVTPGVLSNTTSTVSPSGVLGATETAPSSTSATSPTSSSGFAFTGSNTGDILALAALLLACGLAVLAVRRRRQR